MTVRERIMASLRKGELDYVPCMPTWWSEEIEGFEWARGSRKEYLGKIINELGLDAFLSFSISPSCDPRTVQRVWVEHSAGERFPLIHKEIDTPKGKLKAVVRRTDDYPYERDILFLSDFNSPRYIKPWIENIQDVEKFSYLYLPPDDKILKKSKEEFLELYKLAEKWQVPIIGFGGYSLSAAICLMGAQNAVFSSMDSPEIIERLLEIIHFAQRKTIENMLSWGVEIILRNGWYDTTDLWSPNQYKKWVIPQLKKDINLIHSKEGLFIYQACTGIKPLLSFFNQLEFDCLMDFEPVLGQLSIEELRKELGDKKSFWGGLSAPMHIGRGTPQQARDAVRRSFVCFGHRGFILKPSPSIRASWPWENVLAMIDEWKKFRGQNN